MLYAVQSYGGHDHKYLIAWEIMGFWHAEGHAGFFCINSMRLQCQTRENFVVKGTDSCPTLNVAGNYLESHGDLV